MQTSWIHCCPKEAEIALTGVDVFGGELSLRQSDGGKAAGH